MDPKSAVRLTDGYSMPAIGFGTANLHGEEVKSSVNDALNIGYRLIDTAEIYLNETEVGEAIAESGIPREDIYLTTKISPDHQGNVRRAVKERCELLGMDYVDLCLIHRPPKTGAGEDIWQELIDARDAGYCRSIGVSNYSHRKMMQLADLTSEKPVIDQVEVSPFGFDADFLRQCQDSNIHVQAYSPLTQGDLVSDERIREISNKYNKNAPQILIRWSIQKGMIPLPRSSNHGHIKENYDVFDFKIEEDDMKFLNELNEHYSAMT